MKDIKPIDEHEWSDSYIKSIEVCVDRLVFNYSQPVDDGRWTLKDVEALANALGYKLTKIGGDV